MRLEQLSPRYTAHWRSSRSRGCADAPWNRWQCITVSTEKSQPPSPKSDPRAESRAHLIDSAQQWTHDALEGWNDDNHMRVALAPMAVELLGKAVLWSKNPVLLVPENNESALLKLASDQPDVRVKGLRTVGLKAVLRRVGEATGALSVPPARLDRIADVRNGAVHVGSGEEARLVLIDCLTIIGEFLLRLELDQGDFYGANADLVATLLDKQKSEIARRVSLKKVRARQRLTRYEEEHGLAAFERWKQGLEDERWASFAFRPYGENAAQIDCPECGSLGLVVGELDGSIEQDWDVERDADGGWVGVPSPYVQMTLRPDSFVCNVCRLDLGDVEELAEAGMPVAQYDVEPENLHPDFDSYEFARRYLYDE